MLETRLGATKGVCNKFCAFNFVSGTFSVHGTYLLGFLINHHNAEKGDQNAWKLPMLA